MHFMSWLVWVFLITQSDEKTWPQEETRSHLVLVSSSNRQEGEKHKLISRFSLS